MPPQIKQDLNRSGWESQDFPSLCETCLGDNRHVKMLKEDHGAECKLCTRPFTVFSWAVDRAHGRKKRTNICLTCARLKNACQGCIMDLQYGLPIAIRDKALQMIAPGPTSEVNREYFAQNNEKLLEEGKGGIEQYEKADEKGRELLRKLAQSKPYFRKGKVLDEDGNPTSTSQSGSSDDRPPSGETAVSRGPGPIRSRDSRMAAAGGARPGGRGGGRPGARKGGFPSPAHVAPRPEDWLPPADKNIMSLFVTGVEDDLPEHKVREFFKTYGKIKSLVVAHMSHAAFVNYESRDAAERAAAACQGKAVIAGCPLRVVWSKPKAIGTMNRDERGDMLRSGRTAFPQARRQGGQGLIEAGSGDDGAGTAAEGAGDELSVAPPPGAETVQYASLNGD